jgi:hypothetical protein
VETTDKPVKETSAHKLQSVRRTLGKTVLIVLGEIALLSLVAYATYSWQHAQLIRKESAISSLNNTNARLDASNSSLKQQVISLNNQLQKALNPKPTAPQATPSPKPLAATSIVIINGVKQVPATTYWASAPSSTMYEQVDFTVYNNSPSTQTYSVQVNDSWFKGVTKTGALVPPMVPMGNEWINSTVLAGGHADGFVLFDPASGVTKLQWKAPDASEPIFLSLP